MASYTITVPSSLVAPIATAIRAMNGVPGGLSAGDVPLTAAYLVRHLQQLVLQQTTSDAAAAAATARATALSAAQTALPGISGTGAP